MYVVRPTSTKGESWFVRAMGSHCTACPDERHNTFTFSLYSQPACSRQVPTHSWAGREVASAGPREPEPNPPIHSVLWSRLSLAQAQTLQSQRRITRSLPPLCAQISVSTNFHVTWARAIKQVTANPRPPFPSPSLSSPSCVP